MSGFTAVLSNIMSNVPAVLALRPFIPGLENPERAWLVVAMSSTLAGNFTLLGAVANLIVAEQAKAAGKELSFSAFYQVGLPLMLTTVFAGTAWLHSSRIVAEDGEIIFLWPCQFRKLRDRCQKSRWRSLSEVTEHFIPF